MARTTIPTIGGDAFARRIAELFPRGWASDDAKTEGGNLHALMLSFAEQLSFLLQGVAYANRASRIDTSTSPELDYAARDFFGLGLPRPAGMPDAAYAQLIIDSLFRAAATRPALAEALYALTRAWPRMLEPWEVRDTGAWDAISYWDVDTAINPARWAAPEMRYQGFIETPPPSIPSIGFNNPIRTWDDSAYWDVPGYFFGTITPASQDAVYALIRRLRAAGTLVWVKLTTARQATDIVPPSAITGLTIGHVSPTALELSWAAPATGTPPYSFSIFYRVEGAEDWQVGPTVPTSPATITGLQANVPYQFRVTARNDAGIATSNIVSTTTLKVAPGPARNLTASGIGPTAATISWDLPASGTAPFRFQVHYRQQGAIEWIPFGTAANYLSITVTGLTPQTAYEFQVVTSNT